MTSVIITSTLLGIAAIVIRKLFGSRTGIKPFIIMWAVVFLKFAVPVELPSHFSVMNLFAKPSSSVESTVETPSENDVYVENTPAVTEIAPNSENYNNIAEQTVPLPIQDNTEYQMDIKSIANTVYFSVTALLVFCILFAIIVCTVRFHRLPLLENEVCQSVIKESGIKRKISVRSGEIDTPAVFGVLFPVIILPETIDKNDQKLLRHIMLHESCHIKHFDPLWNVLTLVICAVNWYNPIVWICRYMYLADAEKLCDMSVLNIIGNDNRREYANSLLDCAASKKHPVMLVSGFGESGIKSRIKNIMSIKKVRIIAVIAVFAAVLVSAAIFGTSKNISVSTRDGDSKTSDMNDLYYFSQMIEDDDGEAGKLIVRVYKRNVYYVDISFESEKYTLDSLNSVTVLSKASGYRIYSNGEEKVDYISAAGAVEKGYFEEATYEKELDINDPDYNIDAAFSRFNGKANIKITLEYKLKKGIFNAGSHSFTCEFDPLDPSQYVSESERAVPTEFILMDNSAGYISVYNDDTDEFELRSDKTDIILTISDSYNGFYVVKNVDGKELKQHFEKNISPEDGTPDVSEIVLCDINSDGTDDVAVMTHYRGNIMTLINGDDLSEISVDEEAVEKLLDIRIDQLSDFEFNVSCAGEEHVFTLDSTFEEPISLDEDGNIQCDENRRFYIEDDKVHAEYDLYLNNDMITSYYYLTSVRVEFEYSDGRLVPISAEMDTTNDVYYIKDEPAAKATKVFWKYEIEGYSLPFKAELVSAEGKYFIRSVNSLTGTYYGASVLPTESLPDNIDESFKFTGLDKNDPGLIIFAVPDNGSVFADDMYLATFYSLGVNGRPRRMDIIDQSGRKSRNIRISDNFTAEWGYMTDSYNGDEGKVNMRLEQNGDELHVIDMAYDSEAYRAISGIELKMAMKETDTAQTVYYNADGEVSKKLPIVNGRLYDVSVIFNDICRDLNHYSYLGTDYDASGAAYSVTEINAGGEEYVFTIYDSDILKFTHKDITEFYKLDDAALFRTDHLSIMQDYMDYVMQSFVNMLDGTEHSTAVLSAFVDENNGLGSMSDWKIFKTVSVISDVNYVKIGEDETSRTYKLSFNAESLDPVPFKNGENLYEMVISENEDGEVRITSIVEV
ncbi:MAG: M56 family metallopeptidase [Oscillospiraceae bacterium]